MKTTEILKRAYYALIIVLLLFLLNSIICEVWYGNNRYISFFMLLTLGICWVMTRQNKPVNFKWYTGIIIVFTLIYVYFPLLAGPFSIETYEYLRHSLIIGYVLCAVISTFLSNTKYHNILPNQPKGVSWLFRVLSWLGQLLAWASAVTYVIEILL